MSEDLDDVIARLGELDAVGERLVRALDDESAGDGARVALGAVVDQMRAELDAAQAVLRERKLRAAGEELAREAEEWLRGEGSGDDPR